MNFNVVAWAGILGTRIIRPFFFQYQNDAVPAIRQAAAEQVIDPDEVWFQQDGASPHFARIVRDYLDLAFPGRRIGRRGPLEWPARSPDLAPLDFYFGGMLTSKKFTPRTELMPRLILNIQNESAAVPEEQLGRVSKEFYDRLGYCLAADGNHFEHLFGNKKRHRDYDSE